MMSRRHRRGAHFVMDASRYCRPFDRIERARIMFLVKQLEERTRPTDALPGAAGLAVLAAILS
jgi:hypothetical protein